MKNGYARDIKLDLGDAFKIRISLARICLKSAKLHNICEHGHKLVERYGYFGEVEHIVKHRHSVGDDLRIAGEIFVKVAVL